MAREDWHVRFRESRPTVTEIRRIPIDETPEEVIHEIDRTLDYRGIVWNSTGNSLYIVRDPSDCLEKLLKVASAPANAGKFGKAQHEHRILHRLNQNGVTGVPRVFRFYNSQVDSGYDPEKFTAMLREYVDAEEFDTYLRGSDVYRRLGQLAYEINMLGISLPRDFNGRNVRVNSKGQPYIIDFEESALSDRSYWDKEGNYRKLHELFVANVGAHLEKSKNPLSRILSESPEAVRLIAGLFYKGPVKPTSYGW